MKRYICKLCSHESITPYDHGVHSWEVHKVYNEPEEVIKYKPKPNKTPFLCGKNLKE